MDLYPQVGDRVAASGVYSGTYKATGRSMRAAVAHLYELRHGKIVRMTQYVDTAMVRKALDSNSLCENPIRNR